MQNDSIDNGWVKLHRSMLRWEWWDDRNTRDLFIYCILKANHEDVRWHGKVVVRGTFVTNIRNLAKGAGLTFQQTRTSLAKLESTKEITFKATNKYTIVTITNYDKYQLNELLEQQADQQTNNKQITNKQQTNNNKQEDKEYKEEKNNIISSPNGDVSDLPSDAAPAEEEIKGEKINYPKLVAYWNNQTQGIFGCKLVSIENTRRKRVRARIAQYGKEKFIEAIHKVCESDYLRGATWFSFDWMIRPNNFDKVISGNYDNRQQQPQPGGQPASKLGAGTVTRPDEDTEEVRTDF